MKDIDALVATIEEYTKINNSPTKSIIRSNRCGVEKCKEKLNILSTECPVCKIKHCSSHRIPESHSELCANEYRKQVKQGAKNDALLKLSMQGKGKKTTSLEAERKDIKKRLKEKINQSRK